MNADEAKREAVRILANRLKAWDVDEALKKAQMFMDDLRLSGWRWDAPVNRPQPPRVQEACELHGGHKDRCPGCAADALTGDTATRPAPVRTGPTPEYLQARAASRAAHPTHTDTESE